MRGFGGRDCLLGGRGNDRASGGAGADRLQGNIGGDRFRVVVANTAVSAQIDTAFSFAATVAA